MAYDRYDSRDDMRGQRSQGRDDSRDWDRGRGREDRGWFERAGDEISSWFGHDDDRSDNRSMRERGGWGGEHRQSSMPSGWGSSSGGSDDYSRREPWGGGDRGRFRDEERGGYRPMTGDYGRSEQFFAAGGAPRGGPDRDYRERGDYRRPRSSWSRDDDRSQHHDPHYSSWRQQHMNEIDRDYEDYRRENQSRFEDEFRGWRERRQQKRGLLGQMREHMEVVGSDDEHVGTVDKVAGDRIILTKSDPESGGTHHSLSCTDVDRIEGDRVILEKTAEQARRNWRDESRGRALFEREDQGEAGPHMLDRSFEGTYR